MPYVSPSLFKSFTTCSDDGSAFFRHQGSGGKCDTRICQSAVDSLSFPSSHTNCVSQSCLNHCWQWMVPEGPNGAQLFGSSLLCIALQMLCLGSLLGCSTSKLLVSIM